MFTNPYGKRWYLSYTSILKSVIQELKEKNITSSQIVVRSTVPVDFCDSQNVYFFPEFITEKNWKKRCFKFRNIFIWYFRFK